MALMSSEFDLDSFLELQSSDEDGSDLPELDRSLEDILNDSEDDLPSEGPGNASKGSLFRNPSFTLQEQQGVNETNTVWTEKNLQRKEETKDDSGSFSFVSKEKINRETGNSHLPDPCRSNLKNRFDNGKHSTENKDQESVGETKLSEQGRSSAAKLTELRLSLSMKKSAFWDFTGRPSAFAAPTPAYTPASSLLARSPALSPLLGSVRPSPKPGAALAAAAAASRPVPSPHAAAIKSRKARVLSPKSFDSDGSSDSSKKIEAILEEEKREGSKIVSYTELDEQLFQSDKILSSVRCDSILNKTDDETAKITNILAEQQEGSPSKLFSDVSCIHREGTIGENDEESITGEDDRDKILGENDEERIMGGNDEIETGGMQAGESQIVRNDNDVPPSENEKIPALVHPNIDNCMEIQNPKSTEIHLDDCCNVSVLDSEDTISPSIFSAEVAQTIIQEKQANVVELMTEHKVAKAVDDIVEEKAASAENNRSGKRTGKKACASLKSLDLAEELEKRDASSGLHWEEGAAAQPMRLEGIRREPPAIGHLQIDSASSLSQALASQVFRRDHGSPQALAVHMNYIAVGMSKGTVLVTPSKYSTQNGDNMDTKAFMLGLPVEKSQAAVTSLCFNQQGDLLLVGYGNGTLTLWEVQRATAAKIITGEHSAPIVHTLFLGQDLQVARQFKAITGDCKGLVLLHTFAVVPLLRRFSVTTQCLLDGLRTGTVLSVSPLLGDESQIGASSTSGQGGSSLASGGLGSMMGGVVGGVVGGETGRKLFSDGPSSEEAGGVVIFVTQQTALVVRLIPALEVYAKLSRPDGIREGAMPYTAWRRIPNQQGSSNCKGNSNSISNGNADVETSALGTILDSSVTKVFHDTEDLDKASLLAIAWDRKVQVAQLTKSELKVLKEWSIDNAAQGVAWLDEQMLVVFTSRGQLYLFTKEGMELHRTTLPLDNIGGDGAVTYHTYFVNAFGNPEKAFHNSIAVRGAAIYLLGNTQLWRSRLLPWRERIQALQDAGDWMGALHMAMELYDGNAQGVTGLPRTLDAMREAIMPFLLQLLSSYVDEAFSYISLAFNNQHGKLEAESDGQSQRDSVYVQITEQFARVGGVAIEFCVHIRRTDVLFESIFSKFVGVQHGGTFLELLEPYILKDMLGGLPPEVMQALVEHYSRKGWLQRIEQCVLHMDIASLDFNQVVRLCREHGLYSALIYLFNRGLDDFKAPLEELLAVAQDQQRPNAEAFGYKMLVYLKYCFLGFAFPPGHGYLPPNRLPSLRTELLQFLLDRTTTGYSQSTKSSEVSSQAYPNLCYLLWLDTEATLEVLRCAFVEDGTLGVKETGLLSLGSHSIHSEKWRLKPTLHESSSIETKNSEDGFLLVQALVNALTEVLEMHISGMVTSPNSERFYKGHEKIWPSRKEIGNLLEFIACFVACRHATVSRSMLTRIMEYLASKTDEATRDPLDGDKGEILRRREKLMFALLKGVPESEWETAHALELAQQAQFYQVSGLIYMLKGQYIAALDSYIKDVGEPIHAFAFISNLLKQLADVNDSTLADFRSAVLFRFPELIQLNRELAFVLVLEHFDKENQQIISGLRPHPKFLFLYLKTIMDVHSHGIFKYPSCEGSSEISIFGMRVLDHSKELQDYLDRISNLPQLLQRCGIEVTDEMAELYLGLLCQFEPNSVLKFLESFENYRLEHCLRLCQEYGVTDAAAFLLERVGDVGSALSLTISDVDMRIHEMDSAVAKAFEKISLNLTIEDKQLNELLLMPEVEAVHAILCAAVGLCQRNTLRLDPQESESLWFHLLDVFSEPSRNLYSSGKSSKYENQYNRLDCKSQREEQNEKLSLRWKVLEVGEAAYFLRRILAHFIGEIIEGMMGYVPLPVIMGKLLSDNGSQEFGDFKTTILGMLGTYGYERTILDTAKNMIEDDTYYNFSLLKKGASRAYAPTSSFCSICGRALDKESFSSSICIFHCGHAAHFQCETQDPVTFTKDSLARCPICIPKSRSSPAGSKMIATQNEIFREADKVQQTQAVSAQPLYETAMTERPYGFQQHSRFELLNNLQKGQKSLDLGLLPILRLAPPLVYHDHKAYKSSHISEGESSTAAAGSENLKNARPIWQQKIKSSPFQFPLTSSIFGNDKNKKR